MTAQNQYILQINGLDGGDSVREVAEELLGVEGVSDVEIDEESNCATVDLVEGVPVSKDDLVHAVELSGCTVGDVRVAAL